MSNDSSSAVSEFRGQRVGLIIFGAVQIVIGCLCGMGALFTSLMLIVNPSNMPPEAQLNVKIMLPAVVMYLLVAALFITLGFGSIFAKRWAWSLTVVLSWIWIVGGIFGMIFMVFFMPSMMSSMPQHNQANIPPGVHTAIMIFSLLVAAVIYVVMPGAFLLFYQRKAVWATCQRRDPKTRWTEACPLPVLALSLMLGYSAVFMPFQLTYGGGVAPFFGTLISGVAGTAMILASAVIMAFLAWGTYRQKMAAWWGTLVFWMFWCVSASLTFSKVNMITLYEKMDVPPNQIEMIEKSGILDGNYMIVATVGGSVIALAFLLWVRRYFLKNNQG